MEPSTTQQRSIQMRTSVPGPLSQAILERKEAAVPSCMTIHMPVAAAQGDGALLTDVDGNVFIDFSGGVGCLNAGHSNPKIVEAIIEQVKRFTHTDFTVVMYENYVRLAERINATLPISGPVKSAFFNSGAEAVENSIKIAKAHTGRSGIICFEGAFHGRTLLAMTLTSKTHPYKAGFGPFVNDVHRAPYPSALWEQEGFASEDACVDDALCRIRGMFNTHVAVESVAAMIIEPVLGEGGFVVAPTRFLRGLREICDENGIVLIHDEVQTGMGRTGKLWATEYSGVEPDLLLSAKSIAVGLPLSAVCGKAEIMDSVHDSGIGGTYVGNPVAIEAALAVLDEMEGGLLERGVVVGQRLRDAFEAIAADDDGIVQVRGLGSMLAMEFQKVGSADGNREVGGADSARVGKIIEHAANNGLILLKAGVQGNCIRVLVPLVITDSQIDEAVDVLRAAIVAIR